jgi:hypothetical protein
MILTFYFLFAILTEQTSVIVISSYLFEYIVWYKDYLGARHWLARLLNKYNIIAKGPTQSTIVGEIRATPGI